MRFFIKTLATGFGSGYSPWFPGSAGSAVAALFYWFLPLETGYIIFLCLLGIYICGRAEALLDSHDSPNIVFDEFCGMFIALWHLSSALHFLLAFILFRFFDMVKPYPINKLQKLNGGWGIMADDIAAGLVARVLIYLYMVF